MCLPILQTSEICFMTDDAIMWAVFREHHKRKHSTGYLPLDKPKEIVLPWNETFLYQSHIYIT